MIGISNQQMSIFKIRTIPLQQGNVIGKHIFFLVKPTLIHLIEQDFLETRDAHLSFSQKGETYLELNESDADQLRKSWF